MKSLFAALSLAIAAAIPAQAQNVGECDWLASAWNIVEPWESHSRTFANGEVRLALLDAVEPGAVPFHLLVLSPPYDEMGGRICRVISVEPGIGFSEIVWSELQASYDPAVGLTFHLPVAVWAETNRLMRGLLLRVNQSTGEVSAEILDTPPEWVK